MESLLGTLKGQGQGKHSEGLCEVFPMDNLVIVPLDRDMVALQDFTIPSRKDNYTLPFRWQIFQTNRWDDLANNYKAPLLLARIRVNPSSAYYN